MEYPEELHDLHEDYPLAPTKEVIQEDWLSALQLNMLEQNKIPTQNSAAKLIPTMYLKKNYRIHYSILIFRS